MFTTQPMTTKGWGQGTCKKQQWVIIILDIRLAEVKRSLGSSVGESMKYKMVQFWMYHFFHNMYFENVGIM